MPTPSRVLRALAQAAVSSSLSAPVPGPEPLVSPSALDAVANAMTIPPVHVDHVAEAICLAADETREDVRGVVDVKEMRRLIGWMEKGSNHPASSSSAAHDSSRIRGQHV